MKKTKLQSGSYGGKMPTPARSTPKLGPQRPGALPGRRTGGDKTRTKISGKQAR
jgi:hypothetical protein